MFSVNSTVVTIFQVHGPAPSPLGAFDADLCRWNDQRSLVHGGRRGVWFVEWL